MHKIARTAKNFIKNNRNTLIVGGLLGSVVYFQGRELGEMMDFLKEHNLFDEYYTKDLT